jgi:biopolymer transport protein ExbB
MFVRLTSALVILTGLLSLLPSPAAFAQEPMEPAPAATPAPATPAPAAAPANPLAQDETTAPKPEDSMLMWLIKTSGWIGVIILALSIYFVTVVVQTFLDLWSEEESTKLVLESCDGLLKSRDFAGMYKLVKEEDSFVGKTLTAGLTELQYSLDDAREAVDRVADAQTMRLEKKISMLAVIGSLGPMIGLLGTLKGMISSFSAIATSGTQLKPDQVAHGISEALVLTFEGVALSLPAIFFFAYFRNRIFTLSDDTALAVHDFLRRVHTALKAKPAAGAAPAAMPTSVST